jgi:import receptor subunit TOM22
LRSSTQAEQIVLREFRVFGGGAAAAGRKKRVVVMASTGASKDESNALARIQNTVSQSALYQKSLRAASNTVTITQKLLWSTGKAAWIAGTSFLVFVVPLIIEMDREQQMVDLESQSAGLLGAPPK